jgi:hypothetical protein
MTTPDIATLYAQAHRAGRAAQEAIDLTKIADGSGCCFIKLGKKKSTLSEFAQYCLDKEIARYDDFWGLIIAAPPGENDKYAGIAMKEAYADAFSQIITKAGFYCFPASYLT